MKRNQHSEALGELIAFKRSKLGKTQTQLGQEIGFEQTYVSRIERGKEVPPLENIIKFARGLELADNPGLMVNVLVGSVDANEAKKEASVLQIPEDFTPEEWQEIRDYLQFIQWKRAKTLALPSVFEGVDQRAANAVFEQVLAALRAVSSLEQEKAPPRPEISQPENHAITEPQKE